MNDELVKRDQVIRVLEDAAFSYSMVDIPKKVNPAKIANDLLESVRNLPSADLGEVADYLGEIARGK